MQNDSGNLNNNTAAVITAAGVSSRMGDFKPMLKVGAVSMARRTITNFLQAGIFPVVLVTGYRADELEKHVAKLNVICVRNADYETSTMAESAKIGLSYVRDKCARTFFTPVDIPLVAVSTIKRLMESGADIVRPVCDGICGHPVLLKSSIIEKLIENINCEGLNGAINKCTGNTEWVEVEDEGVNMDADTPEDYQNILKRHNRQLLHPKVAIALVREDKVFDKKAMMLLRTVEYDGTVKDACKKIKMSYSKAWNMISALEANLGYKLIERSPGGEAGGTSTLTQKGRRLLYGYQSYIDRVQNFADECFSDYFGSDT